MRKTLFMILSCFIMIFILSYQSIGTTEECGTPGSQSNKDDKSQTENNKEDKSQTESLPENKSQIDWKKLGQSVASGITDALQQRSEDRNKKVEDREKKKQLRQQEIKNAFIEATNKSESLDMEYMEKSHQINDTIYEKNSELSKHKPGTTEYKNKSDWYQKKLELQNQELKCILVKKEAVWKQYNELVSH